MRIHNPAITGSLTVTGSKLNIDADGNITSLGSVTANQYIVSSSVTNISIATNSGSTAFGDTADDTHVFIGNTISGSSTSTGSFGSISTDKITLGHGDGPFLTEGQDNILKIDSGDGYVEIGPRNSIYAHMITDRSSGFYFVQPIVGASYITATGDINANGNIVGDGATQIKNMALISGSSTSTGSFGRVNAITGFFEAGSKISDYVFEDDYNLRSLGEVEAHISQSKHLPGIPSEANIQEWRDLSMGDRDRLLLEKIEELTLYVISLHKEVEELKGNS